MQQRVQQGPSSEEWEGYEWNIPLDELIDCTKCPKSCQTFYYKLKYSPIYFKTILVILFIGLVISSAAFSIRFGSFNSKTYTMGAGDERLLDNNKKNIDDFSRFFCKALRVDSKSEQVSNTYVFTNTPAFLKRMETFNIVESVAVSSTVFPNWGYHLNANGPSPDKIRVSACSSNILMFHFFSDKSDLNKFINSKGSCKECIESTCQFSPCGSSQTPCTFSAPSTTTIRMALVSSLSTVEEVDISFEFTRSRFDLSNAASTCTQKSTCSTNLPMDTKAIILTLPINATLNPSQLTTECIPRVSMYFAFFLCVPLACFIIFGGFALLLMKLQQSVMKDVEQADRQRQYRQMGYRTDSSVTPSVVRQTHDNAMVTSPPPAYPIRATSSSRAPLVVNEQPVGSLPDYDSVKQNDEHLPSYESLNNNI